MNRFLALPLLILAMAFSTETRAQKFSGLDKSPLDQISFPLGHTVATKNVRILYSRPQLKGRSLSDLAPEGKVWRTGANEATEITFYKDATLGGQKIEAGTYSLFTIPGENEWTIILNRNLHQWGAFSYDQSADVVRVPAKVAQAGESLEAFSMAFKENGELIMGWGTARVAVPMAF